MAGLAYSALAAKPYWLRQIVEPTGRSMVKSARHAHYAPSAPGASMNLCFHSLLAAGLFLLAGAAAADSPMSPTRPLPKPAGASPPSQESASTQAKPAVDLTVNTGIKSGEWQFISELAAAARSNGGAHATYESCVDETNALPAEFGPECQLQRVERKGSQIVWAVSCPGRQTRIDGVAHYSGDTMEATVVTHLPGSANGASGTAVTQHIAGHFLGACTRGAQPQSMPQPAPANPNATAGEVPVAEASIEPPPSTNPTAAVAPAEAPQKAAPPRHIARVTHHYRRHYVGWGFAGIYSNSAYSDRGRDY
jgi:uncharacterized protein DUF3617